MTVVVQPNPFKQEKYTRYYPAGKTIQQLFGEQSMYVPIENCHIIVNDVQTVNYELVPSDDDIVIIKALPAGEQKEEVGGAVTGSLLGFVAGVTAFAFGVATAGVILGGMVVGATLGFLIVMVGEWFDSGETAEQYSLKGKANDDAQYKPVPVLYGTSKFAPSYGAHDYTTKVERSDSTDLERKHDVYLHQLYVLGYHPTVVNNIKLGNAYLADTHTLSVTATLSASAGTITSTGSFDTASKMYTGAYISVVGSASSDGQYIVDSFTDNALTVTPIIADYAIADETDVAITISFLITDSDNCVYSDVSIQLLTDGDFSSSNYPTQIRQAEINTECPLDAYQYYTTPANIQTAVLDFGFLNGLGRLKKDNSAARYSARVTFVIEAKPVESSTWTEMTRPTYTGRTDEAYTFSETLNLADKFGEVRGQYNIRIKKTAVEHQAGGAHSSTWYDSTDNDVPADSLVRHALTWVSTQTTFVDADGDAKSPIDSTTAEDLLCLVLKIKATDQLNGTINNLTVNATRWVHDYDSTSGTWIVRETHNPASMFRDVLSNSLLAQHPTTYNSTYFDTDSLEEWHTWCATTYEADTDEGTTEYTYTCDGVLFDSTTVEEELSKICATGRASFTIIDGKYHILQLIEKDTPVQLFTTRNIIKDSFSVTRTYDTPPDNVIVKYVDALSDYLSTQVETNSETATTNTTVEYPYVNSYGQAYALGRFIENSFQSQILTYTFQAGVDALVATRGDRIRLQHDAALISLTSGRISSFTESGNKLLTITLDEPVTMTSGEDYAVIIRTPTDMETYPVETVAGVQYTVTVKNPTSIADHGIATGDLFVYGIASSVTADLVITDIQYDANLNATITACEYDEDIYDISEIPAYESPVTKSGSRTVAGQINVSPRPNLDEAVAALQTQQNVVQQQVFHYRPTTPYNVGDMWLNGANIYDCISDKASTQSYSQADWRRRSSGTFEVLNKDTFNEPTPEHRWQQIPGDALAYNLLAVTTYTASHDPNTDKEEILVEDATNWTPENTLVAITVEGESAEYVQTSGSFDTAYLVGRYESNGYMGEAYSNELTGAAAPASQNVSVTSGSTYVVQCHRGTITCSYGTASENSPLTFTATATESLALTMADCQYGCMTETDFTPPYVATSFSANSDTATTSGTTLQITSELVNIPTDASYGGICTIEGDSDNYIKLYIEESYLYIDIKASGNTYTEAVKELSTGDLRLSLDWSDGVILRVNYVPYTFTETGDVYGYDDESGYGFDTDYYGFGDADISFGTDLTDITLGVVGGLYFNNVITEVVYDD